MRFSRLPVALAIAVTLAPTCLEAGGQSKKPTAPETISANAQAKGSAGAASTRITMKIERYSADADSGEAVVAALKQGYPEILAALRKAPVVGTLTFAGQTFDIRWAREQPVANGRNITIVTDKPVFSWAAAAWPPSRARDSTWRCCSSGSTMPGSGSTARWQRPRACGRAVTRGLKSRTTARSRSSSSASAAPSSNGATSTLRRPDSQSPASGPEPGRGARARETRRRHPH